MFALAQVEIALFDPIIGSKGGCNLSEFVGLHTRLKPKPAMEEAYAARKLADDVLAAQSAKLAEQAQMLRDLAARDELTGPQNRRGFFDAATHSLEMARQCVAEGDDVVHRPRRPEGHQQPVGDAVGDRALTVVADALRTLTDTRRIAGRVGGDEFCILETPLQDLPFPTEAGVEAAIAAAAVEADLPLLRASIGKVDASCASDLDELIAMSDVEMYARKRDRSADILSDSWRSAMARMAGTPRAGAEGASARLSP